MGLWISYRDCVTRLESPESGIVLRAWYGHETLDIYNEPLIFTRQLKFICLGSKSDQIFDFVVNLN